MGYVADYGHTSSDSVSCSNTGFAYIMSYVQDCFVSLIDVCFHANQFFFSGRVYDCKYLSIGTTVRVYASSIGVMS